MILVSKFGPPSGFSVKVVSPAKNWAVSKNWDWNSPPPVGQSNLLRPYWRKALNELHDVHGGICAYLSVYTHRAMQCSSVDHFLPRSKSPIAFSYDWSNFRLASRPMNTNKHEFQDVLDPFTLPLNLFTLNLLSGRLIINPEVAPIGSSLHQQAMATLSRLKLNNGEYRDLRLTYLDQYLSI